MWNLQLQLWSTAVLQSHALPQEWYSPWHTESKCKRTELTENAGLLILVFLGLKTVDGNRTSMLRTLKGYIRHIYRKQWTKTKHYSTFKNYAGNGLVYKPFSASKSPEGICKHEDHRDQSSAILFQKNQTMGICTFKKTNDSHLLTPTPTHLLIHGPEPLAIAARDLSEFNCKRQPHYHHHHNASLFFSFLTACLNHQQSCQFH